MEDQKNETLQTLIDRFVQSGVAQVPGAEVTKTAAEGPPTAAEVSARLESPDLGEEGKKLEAKAVETGEHLDAPAGKAAMMLPDGTPAPLGNADLPKGMEVKNETGTPMSEVVKKLASDLKALDAPILARYQGETLLRKAAGEVARSMQGEIESFLEDQKRQYIADEVSRRLKKSAEEVDAPGNPEASAVADIAGTGGAVADPAVDPALVPDAGGSPELPPEAGAAGEGGGAGMSMEDAMAQLPPEFAAKLQELVTDVSERLGIPPDQALEQLNQIGAEVLEENGMTGDDVLSELSKQANEVEMGMLLNRLQKLAEECEIPGDDGIPAAPEGEEAMAEAMLGDNVNGEDAQLLAAATAALEDAGIDPETINISVKNVVSGDVPEDLLKVAAEGEEAVQGLPLQDQVTVFLHGVLNHRIG